MTMQTDELGPDTPRNRGDYGAPHTSPVTPAEDIRTILLNRVSGTAILIGAFMTLAFQLILNLFGVGVGAAYSAPFANVAQAAAYLSGGALLWWAISGIVAAFIGGLTAGRLSGQPKQTSAGWHGLGAWSISVVVVAILMTGIIGSVGAAQGKNANISMMIPGSTAGTSSYNNNGGAAGNAANPGSTGANASLPGNTAANSANGGNSVAVDAKTTAQVSIISAIALLIGAFAAWFGGWVGAVQPTVTDPDLRASSFHSL
jgi:hypothetical protein